MLMWTHLMASYDRSLTTRACVAFFFSCACCRYVLRFHFCRRPSLGQRGRIILCVADNSSRVAGHAEVPLYRGGWQAGAASLW